LKTFLVKFSQFRGSSFQASLAHKCAEWQTHLRMKIPGNFSLKQDATEFEAPIITLQPSDPNPIILASGMLNFENDSINKVNNLSAVAIHTFSV